MRKDKEADTRNQGAKEDETMPDVNKPMHPIDPPPHEPSSSKRRPSWLRETPELRDTLHQGGLFVKARSRTDPPIHKCKRELASEFEMKDLELMHYFLGLEVCQKPGEIFISQGKYVVKILKIFGMVDCKPVTTPMELNFKKLCGSATGPKLENAFEYCQLIRALMFFVKSRPDICIAVNRLSQYKCGGLQEHFWMLFFFGFFFDILDEQEEKSVALSTAKAEYIAVSMASCEAV
eukprot:PITA_15121